MLAEFLVEGFNLLEYFDCTHYMPLGEPRPYIYILFQKKQITHIVFFYKITLTIESQHNDYLLLYVVKEKRHFFSKQLKNIYFV